LESQVQHKILDSEISKPQAAQPWLCGGQQQLLPEACLSAKLVEACQLYLLGCCPTQWCDLGMLLLPQTLQSAELTEVLGRPIVTQ